jgi:S1-C subfamily serine protease
VPYFVALIFFLLVLRPAAADLGAAEAAEQRGDPAAAYQACKADAEAGDAGCQNYLGVLSELGRGTARDAAEARRLFRLPAMQGLAAAQYNLGRHYVTGLGLRKDEAEAARWYRMAAEQGSPAVQNALAILDATGRGVLRDPKAALELFRLAAMSGYTLAQLNLGVAFEHGRLMPHDLLRAYIWYSIAARSGSDQALREQAAQGRDRLEQKIPLSEMVAARLAVGSWTSGNPEPDGGAAPPRRHARRSPGGKQPSSGGSGFIVSRTGVVLTNNHVVEGCRELRVMRNEKPVGTALVAADPADDLAILRLPEPVADSAPLRGDIPVKRGEAVAVVGTAGIVSRLAGPHDDAHQLQITAPVQPGNSGSPLLDASGAVAGIVVAKLNGLRIIRRTGTIPENVNFAVNAKYARALLDRNGVPYQTATDDETLSTPAIAERALKFTVLVQCSR